ncbi:MAG: hypothetical protein MJZ34_02590 [Paludibacteraceae bacterium]|nr:hypothetical protein [Paludibacteraceae bacterium]
MTNYIKELEEGLYKQYECCCHNCMHYNDNHEDYDCLTNPNHVGVCEYYKPWDYCTTSPYERLTKLLHDLVDRLHSYPTDTECKEALEYFITYQIKE